MRFLERHLSLLVLWITGLCLCSAQVQAAVGLQITNVDHYRLPPGQHITLTGSGFTNLTQARFIYGSSNLGSDSISTVSTVSSTSAQIAMPDFSDPNGYHTLILESETASTVGIPSGSRLQEHTGNGPPTNPYHYGTVVIRSGALLSGQVHFGIIIVESGGVLEMDNNSRETTVYAEDGAVVNVTSISSEGSTIYHSPDTILIGDTTVVPWNSSNLIELPSLTPSYGIDVFSQGTPVDIEFIGEGSISRRPDIEYFPYYGYAYLTAVPAPGYMFTGWSGDQTSFDETIRVYINENVVSLTATFSEGWQLKSIDIPGATTSLSPEQELYADEQIVDLSTTLDPGYEFLGWGGHADGNELSSSITMDSNRLIFPIVRSSSYATLPHLEGADQYTNVTGETMTVTGTALASIHSAQLIFRESLTPMNIGNVSDSSAELIMPETPNSRFSAYHLFIETESGSTLTVPPNCNYHTTDGELSDTQDSRPVVVRAGGSLTGGTTASIVIVEAGAYYSVNQGANLPYFIFAEDGAVIDFRSAASPVWMTLYYSPETIIIGEPPTHSDTSISVVEPISSLRISHDFELIRKGAPINLTINGNGNVEKTPDSRNYAYGTTVSIRAIPTAGSYFNSWSGDILSTDNTISHTFGYDPLNLTANFSTGWQLTFEDVPQANVSLTPNLTEYTDGQVVTVNATPNSGYYLEGWAGDASGSDASIEITMDGNKRIVPIIRPNGYSTLPQLDSADYPVVAYNEDVVIRGTNLASAKTASLMYSENKFNRSATNKSDTSFSFLMPSPSYGKHADHFLFLDAVGGATVGIFSHNEHTTVGPTPLGASFDPMVVRAGAVLNGYTRSELIMVESGGTLRVDDSMVQLKHIIAEDGAIVDFRNASTLNDAKYFYSPATLTHGSIPANTSSHRYGSIRPSYGMDEITLGYEVNLEVNGPGAVHISPNQPAHRYLSTISLTATPDSGAYFIRWTGDQSNIYPTSEFTVRGTSNITGVFSTATNYFSVWRLEHFTDEELEDITISAFDADPDRDSLSNSAEYAFGSDPRSSDKKQRIKVDKKRVDGEFEFTVTYPRPKGSLDVTYQILVSKDLLTWNFNGDDTDLVYSEEISVESIDDDTEEVTSILYPNNDSPKTFFVKVSALLFQ